MTPGLSGALGPLVVCHGKQGTYTRRKAVYNSEKLSPKQQAQLLKFGLANRFVNSIKELAMQSFFDPRGLHGQASAVSFTMRNAIAGEHPNFYLYHQMLYTSLGTLPGPINAQVVASNETLTYTWQNPDQYGIAKPNDLAIVVAYNETSNASYYLIGPAIRSQQMASLYLPAEKDQSLHTWLSFLNHSRTDASTSVYTGLINL